MQLHLLGVTLVAKVVKLDKSVRCDCGLCDWSDLISAYQTGRNQTQLSLLVMHTGTSVSHTAAWLLSISRELPLFLPYWFCCFRNPRIKLGNVQEQNSRSFSPCFCPQFNKPLCSHPLLHKHCHLSQRLTGVTLEGAVGKQDLKCGSLAGNFTTSFWEPWTQGLLWGLCSPHRHLEGTAALQYLQHMAEIKDQPLMQSTCEFIPALGEGLLFQGTVSPVCISKRQRE